MSEYCLSCNYLLFNNTNEAKSKTVFERFVTFVVIIGAVISSIWALSDSMSIYNLYA